MLPETRTFQRISIKAAVHRIRKRWQTVGASNASFLPRSAKLSIELGELRTARNIIGIELPKFGIGRQGERKIRCTDRSGEIVTDEYAQRSRGYFFIGPSFLEFIATSYGLQLGAGQIDGRNFAATQKERGDALEFFGSSEITFRGGAFRYRQRQFVIGFDNRLRQCPARHVRPGVRRFEQGAMRRQ